MVRVLDKETVLIIIVIAAGIILTLSNEFIWMDLDMFPDIDGSLIVGITASITISLVLLKINKRHQIRINRQVSEIRTIVVNQDRSAKREKENPRVHMLDILIEMDKQCSRILKDYSTYMGVKNISVKGHISIADQNWYYLRTASQNIDKPEISLDKYLDADMIKLLKSISSSCKIHSSSRGESQSRFVTQASSLQKNIKSAIDKLSNLTEKKFFINTDRSKYPPESKVYVEVVCMYIRNRDIIIEVFDEDGNKMMTEKINPEKNKSESNPSHIYEINFDMDKKWKIGEIYTIKATYGMFLSENLFTIDRFDPAIMTDKDVYDLKDEVSISLIYPSLVKDIKKIQHVKNKYPKLTILSPHDKIVQYRLNEMDKETGIFLGTIKIIGPDDCNLRIPDGLKNSSTDLAHKKTRAVCIKAKAGDVITITCENNPKSIKKTITVQ